MKLYSTPLSGHGHRVEQFLRFLDIPFEYIEAQADFRKSAEFIALNPFGQIPVLVDGDLVLSDSCAILVYLAKTYALNSHWLPDGAIPSAQIQRWLATEQMTIADIACYVYVAHVPEGGVALSDYPHVRRWIADFESLPKFKGITKQG